MLRNRDIVAVILAVILTRMAWTNDQESNDGVISASLRLAFYAPARLAAPFDVDGDGTHEAMVVATKTSQKWELQILDLKPLHHTTSGLPFLPSTLFTTNVILNQDTVPLKMITAQILLHHHKRLPPKSEFVPSNDPKRHYFCGTDWHNAAATCGIPCSSGSSTDCPAGQTCYADTPCDSEHLLVVEETHVEVGNFTTTPGGGLPSVITYWADGTVTLHSLTSSEQGRALQLREMWSRSLAGLEADQVHIEFLGAADVIVSEKNNLGRHGMVLVGGGNGGKLYALDALTGGSIWDTSTTPTADMEQEQNPILPLVPERGMSSHARRRSKIVHVQNQTSTGTEIPNCLVAYRHSLLSSRDGALPHIYWDSQDIKIVPLHLERHVKSKEHHFHKAKKTQTKKLPTKKHGQKSGTPVYGRPNVLLSHSRDGIHVRSLKNGRLLCHVSLMTKVLYADLNHDGILDNVQVITDQDTSSEENEFVQALVQNLQNSKKELHKPLQLVRSHRLCHVLALSGMPAREQLFAAHLCGHAVARDHGDHPFIQLHPAPPLVLDGTDVVVALNNGMVSRYHAPTGARLWQVIMEPSEDFPTWGRDSSSAYLTTLEHDKAATKPILWMGENGMMLLSPKRGKVLAFAMFPQLSLGRPILADVSGDGTLDIVVRSADAIWGYQVGVRAGSSALFQIMVGLLLMGMALALLRNRFGQQHSRVDKRSTDA